MPRAGIVLLIGMLSGCAVQSSGPLDADQSSRAAEANTEIAAYHLQRGEYPAAIKKIERALDQAPDLVAAHLVAAELHARIDRPQAAQRYYRQALELEPKNGSALNNYAAFLCQQSRLDRALDLWRLAASDRLYPGRAMALANAGRCLADAGRWSAARRYWRRALAIRSDYPPALLGMAEASRELGEKDAAQGWISRYTAASEDVEQAPRLSE